ncbi:methyltransferase-like protein 22 isoform X1 [Portunus trituberculatus]|uniref:methyltransferase-like protein 22 isoform X1 n=1 Tax=Portunus trituberculatus TaxID=210409 RepID=UPI001E1D0938|nr:methyltransferase-like protein 22 isoform X1 [Portunus trituberculatus]
MAEEEEVDNTVTSEVHHFSKEETLKGGREGGSYRNLSEKGEVGTSSDLGCEGQQEQEDEEFECLLGANGQVVLWSPRRETVLSRFDFAYPPDLQAQDRSPNSCPQVDSDGDLVVTRRKDLHLQEGIVLIEHQNATTLDLVGEQVWRGALFLADFILHYSDIFRGKHVLEVASGVGLTSVVAAMLAIKITVTDVDKGEILELIRRNLKRNEDVLKAEVCVKEIDFYNHDTIDDLQANNKDVSVILAADVVYNNPLTDAFFSTVLRLMSDPPEKTMFIALEKRYVFTMEDMDSVAPCYEYFLDGLEWLRSQRTDHIEWTVEELPSDFEQYFTYERTRHLVLWKINAKLKQP